MLTREESKKTPLYDEHLALGARMVPFGGWAMPLQYDGILREHAHTRAAVSVFDTSHMGEFVVEGGCAESGLERIVTMSLADLPIKAGRYGCILNEQGGVIDDLVVFREGERKWFIVVNGATTQKDAAHFQSHLTDKAAFEDVSLRTGKIDVQGPLSRDVLRSFVAGVEKLDYYTFDYFDLWGERVLISRTGYTGELGYEIYFPWEKLKELWRALIGRDKVKPAGLGARDVLRLEMGYSLYGHELGEGFSPLEAGLARFIHFEKDFIGRDVLLKEKEEGIRRTIAGIRSETRRSPRQGHVIYSQDGEAVGTVTSGAFSPTLGRGIGLGLVAAPYAGVGTAVFFGNGNNKNAGKIASRAFYKGGSLKA